MKWIKEVFGTEKPIVAMCHLQAMPGDPYYDKGKGMKDVLDKARHDLLALQNGAWMRLCLAMNSAFLI